MRYAILGAGGVFGNNCAKYLLTRPDTELVMAIGRNPRPAEPFSLNVGVDDERYSYWQIDITDCFQLALALKKMEIEVVVNYAALAISQQRDCWGSYSYTNSHAVVRMCEQLHASQHLKRFIQIGTSELYGSVEVAALENSPLKPSTHYAASKLAADMFLQSIHHQFGFPMNIIRPSNCYAPGQLLYRIIPRAIVCGLSGKKLPLQGGQARKSYMHADDLSRAVHLVATRAEPGKIYNAGPVHPISIENLAGLCASELGLWFEDLWDLAPARQGEDSMYWVDSSAIRRDLQWRAEIGIRDGIQDMIAWGKKYLEQVRNESQEIRYAA